MRGTFHGMRIAVGSEKNDGRLVAVADVPRGFNAVHFAFDDDIHEHQGRMVLLDLGNRILAVIRNPADPVAHFL